MSYELPISNLGITAHLWYDGHFTSINACRVWVGRGQGPEFKFIGESFIVKLG